MFELFFCKSNEKVTITQKKMAEAILFYINIEKYNNLLGSLNNTFKFSHKVFSILLRADYLG
jgi:hypothetical protein